MRLWDQNNLEATTNVRLAMSPAQDVRLYV